LGGFDSVFKYLNLFVQALTSFMSRQAGPLEFLKLRTYFRVKVKKISGFAHVELLMSGNVYEYHIYYCR
jgi:hypothetical protein